MNFRSSWSTLFYAGMPLAIAGVYIFWQLGKSHLIEFDEGIYAVIAKNIVLSGDLLKLNLNLAVPWLDKPPLYFWLSALVMKLFGFTTLAARLPSALFGLGTVFLTFLLGRKLFNLRTGFISALVLASTVGFLYYSRLGMVDVTLTFFLTGAILFFYLGLSQPRYFFLMGLFLGLGLMTKNFIGLLDYLVIFLYFVFSRSWKSFAPAAKKIFLRGIVISLLVALPWHLYMLFRYGRTFFDVYFFYHTFSRVGQVIEGESAPLFWYVTVIRTQFRIWFGFLLTGLIWAFWKLKGKDGRFLLPILTTSIIFVGFSLSQSKLIWFILPIYPSLSLIVGSFLGSIADALRPKTRNFFLLLILIIAIYYPWRRFDIISPVDFNNDFVQALVRSDEINPQKQLVVSGNFYVADYYNRGGQVSNSPIEEIKNLIIFSRDKFLLVTSKELPKDLDLNKYAQSLNHFGDYLLIEK